MLAKQQKNIRKSKEMFQCFYRLKKDNYFSLGSRVGFGSKITSENNSLVSTFSRLNGTEVLFNVDIIWDI